MPIDIYFHEHRIFDAGQGGAPAPPRTNLAVSFHSRSPVGSIYDKALDEILLPAQYGDQRQPPMAAIGSSAAE